MTPEQIARNIVRGNWTTFDSKDIPSEEWRELESRIVSVLEEYADEKMIEQLKVDHAYLESERIKARAKALEQAASIAEYHSGPSVQLAEKIRALARGKVNNA